MKRIGLIVVLVISLIIINNLIRSIYNLWQKQELVGKTVDELAREKEEYKKLQAQYVAVQKEDFIEKQARDRLFLVKPGEEIVILPGKEKDEKKVVSKKRKRKLSPAEEWLALFSLAKTD